MGRKIGDLLVFPIFIKNILWFNIKRFKINSFWRIIFFIINFMLFLSTFFPAPGNFSYYIFIIVTLSNFLFIYSRINSRVDTFFLLRQFGASLLFIIIDNIIEILLIFFSSAVTFLIASIFLKPSQQSFLFIIYQLAAVIFFIPIVSLVVIMRLEKEKKEH